MHPRLLITGASGHLGRRLSLRALQRLDAAQLHSAYASSPDRICGGTPLRIDLTSRGAEEAITTLAPDTIIHAAALPPGSGDDVMTRTIVNGSRCAARAASTLGARLVHVSTDVLHDGLNAPYADDAPATPVDAYGRAKALAEAEIRHHCPSAAIVRTSLIYGLDEIDRGTEGFARRLEAGETLALFRDVLRQPVWVESLAEALLGLALDHPEFSGCLNVVGDQVISREDFGLKLLEWWKVPGREAAKSILARDLPSPPPLDLRLNNRAAKNLLGIELPGVDSVLARGQALAASAPR